MGDGRFECSSVTSDRPDLWSQSFNNGSVACKYGHTEVDGLCEHPADGVRSAPCRCQTKEEAKYLITQGAQMSLWISMSAFLIGGCCSWCTCKGVGHLQWKINHWHASSTDSERMPSAGAGGSDGRGVPAAAAGAVTLEEGVAAPEDDQPPAALGEAQQQLQNEARGEAEAEAGGEPAVVSAVNDEAPALGLNAGGALRQLDVRTRRIYNENLAKFHCLRWFFPLIFAGSAAIGAYFLFKGMEHPDNFYKHLGDTLGIVGLVCTAFALCFVMRAAIADSMLICVGRMCGTVCCVFPVMGVAGIVWSVRQMVDADEEYHDCQVRRCLWAVC